MDVFGLLGILVVLLGIIVIIFIIRNMIKESKINLLRELYYDRLISYENYKKYVDKIHKEGFLGEIF